MICGKGFLKLTIIKLEREDECDEKIVVSSKYYVCCTDIQ